MKNVIAALVAVVLTAAASLAAGAAEQWFIDFENATTKAFMQKDAAFFSANLADDWVMQDGSGRHTKAELVSDLKSGKFAVTSMTNRDMHVRVMGNVAIVQGMEDEKSTYAGKNTSGAYSWIDVLEKRGGKWLVVATQVSKITK